MPYTVTETALVTIAVAVVIQTLLIVERTQYQAEDTLLQVRLQHLQAAVGLFRALGGDFAPQTLASHSPAQVAQP